MLFEDPLKEEREEESYYSYTHEYEDAERDDLLVVPGKADACRNDCEKNGGGKVCKRQKERVLYGLLYGLVKPGDKRESVTCRRKDCKQEEYGREHGPLIILGEDFPYHVYLKSKECGKDTVHDPKDGGSDEVLLETAEEFTEYRRVLTGCYLNSNLI